MNIRIQIMQYRGIPGVLGNFFITGWEDFNAEENDCFLEVRLEHSTYERERINYTSSGMIRNSATWSKQKLNFVYLSNKED